MFKIQAHQLCYETWLSSNLYPVLIAPDHIAAIYYTSMPSSAGQSDKPTVVTRIVLDSGDNFFVDETPEVVLVMMNNLNGQKGRPKK